MKNKITERQQEIFNFIQAFLSETGYPPTLREIAKKFEMSSTFGVRRHLEALAKKGYLTIESNASRGITLLKTESEKMGLKDSDPDDRFNSIPIVGRVAAGSPILAIENIESSLIIDPSFVKKTDDAFALHVTGDSMINAGINEGDIVIVSPNDNSNNGDIVVAMLDGEVTVKTLEIKNNKIRLIPENKKYTPIEINEINEFKIIGKVKGVLRWLN
jgi:repressor LexA